MNDLAYLVPDNAKAWLDGRGDGRFESYERYYRRALRRHKDDFDVEAVNEQFETFSRARGRAPAFKIGNVIVAMTLIGFGLYVSGKAIVKASDISPKSTGIVMLVCIVALKMYQRWQRQVVAKN